MTAKEMFKELGHKYFYEKNMDDDELTIERITFYRKNDNSYAVNDIQFDITKKIIIINALVDIDLLKAINQQCKELGWLE